MKHNAKHSKYHPRVVRKNHATGVEFKLCNETKEKGRGVQVAKNSLRYADWGYDPVLVGELPILRQQNTDHTLINIAWVQGTAYAPTLASGKMNPFKPIMAINTNPERPNAVFGFVLRASDNRRVPCVRLLPGVTVEVGEFLNVASYGRRSGLLSNSGMAKTTAFHEWVEQEHTKLQKGARAGLPGMQPGTSYCANCLLRLPRARKKRFSHNRTCSRFANKLKDRFFTPAQRRRFGYTAWVRYCKRIPSAWVR